jgi:hypothetical protein
MTFVWFWTFWHWSRESFRTGRLLRGPLLGIAGHWDEWFRHEASEDDRRAIEEAGRTERGQREFIIWLRRHWAREAGGRENRWVPRFVLRQLAQVPPFNDWSALAAHRASYGATGIHAIVLEEESRGEPGDVRPVEAVALPLDAGAAAPAVVPEGFQADEAELETARRAAASLLGGRGLLAFLGLWIACGRRPYPRRAHVALGLGWLLVIGAILYLLAGPEPGESLLPLSIALLALWCALAATSVLATLRHCFRAWRTGRELRARLERSQVRLCMNIGLKLKGGSAGLAFCLNMVAAACRARPGARSRSWLWRRLSRELGAAARSWAATGVVTAGARVKPVVLEPKLRACLMDARIRNVLVPRQRDASRRSVERLSGSPVPAERPEARLAPLAPRLGFAAERRGLACSPVSHAAQSLLVIGGFRSAWQMALNAAAVVASAAMLVALPDLRSIVFPPPAPAVVAPSSPSPYYLWVSLDTEHPDRFLVVLESGFWSNRRAEVTRQGGASPSARAEIRLHRPARQTASDTEDGTVWIERRRRFLTREFAPGERVGRYSFSHVSRLGHD